MMSRFYAALLRHQSLMGKLVLFNTYIGRILDSISPNAAYMRACETETDKRAYVVVENTWVRVQPP